MNRTRKLTIRSLFIEILLNFWSFIRRLLFSLVWRGCHCLFRRCWNTGLPDFISTTMPKFKVLMLTNEKKNPMKKCGTCANVCTFEVRFSPSPPWIFYVNSKQLVDKFLINFIQWNLPLYFTQASQVSCLYGTHHHFFAALLHIYFLRSSY